MIKINNKSSLQHEWQTCYECHVAFVIYPGQMKPDDVSRILHLLPTEQYTQGDDIITPWGKVVRAPMSSWFLSSKEHVDSKDLRAHLQWLLDALQPFANAIQILHAIPGLDMHIQCTWISRYGDGGPSVWPEQLSAIAELGLECHFDTYCEEPMFSEALVNIPNSNTEWTFGGGTPERMKYRGWTSGLITEAILKGKQLPACNHVHKDNEAIRYIHPDTEKSIVVDMVTRELIHIGGNDFMYPSGYNKLSEDDESYICVRLLGEGTIVYKPVKALYKGDDVYYLNTIPSYNPQKERWEFEPDSYVHVNIQSLSDGEYIVATKKCLKVNINSKIFI